MKLKGYRRFKEESTINLTGKLICLIGSNEAGKTSILKALESLNNNAVIEKNDIYRSTAEKPEESYIKARFLLSPEDLDEARLVAGSKLEITKTDKDGRVLSFDPEPPKRDTTLRLKMKEKLKELTMNVKFIEHIKEVQPNGLRNFQQLLSTLQSQNEDLNVQTLNTQIKNCNTVLQAIDDVYAEDKQFFEKGFEALIKDESLLNPTKYAISVIEKKVPKFLLFKDEDRDLQYQYTVGEIPTKPKPLATLAQLANLDLPALVQTINDDDSSRYKGMLSKANEKLKNIFDGKWSQSLLEINLEIKNKSLEILLHEGDYEYSELSRRSDGFRQFLALIAFATLHDSENIILLMDEIELHLHYDGQADLLQTLAKQLFAKKVIYTTHSIGSLPEDLGGVKIVARIPTGFTSTIENKFWKQGEGIATLLPNIGAEQLAFLPLRNAVIVEGAMDMLLLPIIFQEAIAKDNIGFLIVHGLAEKSLDNIIYLEKRNGSNALYLTDCDEEGKKYKMELIKQKIDEKKIFSLPGDLGKNHIATLEDMLSKECLVSAFNKLIKRYYIDQLEIDIKDITDDNKADCIKKLAEKRNIKDYKVAIAYEILSLLADSPDIKIVDQKYLKSLKELYQSIIDSFVSK